MYILYVSTLVRIKFMHKEDNVTMHKDCHKLTVRFTFYRKRENLYYLIEK